MFISQDDVRGLQNGGIRGSVGHDISMWQKNNHKQKTYPKENKNIREMVVKKTAVLN